MLETSCTNEQKRVITLTPVTPSGNPAQLDGMVTVTVVSGDGTVEGPTEEDPLTFRVVSGANPGVTEYLVEGDADLGEGVVAIQDTIRLTVEGAQAAAFGLQAGAVEPK